MFRRAHSRSNASVGRPGDLLGVRQRLLGAVEHVARDRALGQDEQLGAGGGGLLEPREAGLEVPLLLAKLGSTWATATRISERV